jgi:hypothetical protein
MALATSVTGDGILVSSGVTTNISQRVIEYTDGSPSAWTSIKEVAERETREWVALTQSAAEGAKDTNAQPAEGTYTYEVSEQDRYTHAYKLSRMFEQKTTSLVSPFNVATPTFDPVAGAYAEGSLEVAITSATANSEISYAVISTSGAVVASGNINSGDAITITVPSTIIAWGFKSYFIGSPQTSAVYTVEE